MRLKGYLLRIAYSDGTTSTHRYEPDELGTLDDKITGLMQTDLAGIQGYSIVKEWI